MADSLETRDLGNFYSKSGILRYGNNEEVRGLNEIAKVRYLLFLRDMRVIFRGVENPITNKYVVLRRCFSSAQKYEA